MGQFKRDERVVCVSNRRPCCETPIEQDVTPEVGEIYTVTWNVMARCMACGQYCHAIQTTMTPASWAWPEVCFKRVPPQTIVKERKVSTPVLEDV